MRIFSVPNLFSLGNLLCGCIATLNIIEADFYPAAICVGIACVFDFLDGFAARGLKQGSPMGKELDSLADMVTFGVVPGMVMFQLIRFALMRQVTNVDGRVMDYLPYAGFLIPLFSGLRLAKFNVDTRQSESFIGLPTLANAILVVSLPLALGLSQGPFAGLQRTPTAFDENNPENALSMLSYLQRESSDSLSLMQRPYYETPNDATFWDCGEYIEKKMSFPDAARNAVLTPWVLLSITVIFSILLLSPIPMFSFKIKSVKWKGNEVRYIFLVLSAALLVWLRWTALPMVIVLYILLSIVNALVRRKSS